MINAVASRSATINGSAKLQGTIRVSGAKNAATRLLAAALIADGTVTLQNFPTELVDVQNKSEFIRSIGGTVSLSTKTDTATVSATGLQDIEAPSYDVPIRTTYLLAAALLKRFGRARIPYPGGCKIGSRGYDLHIAIWEKIGCTVDERDGFIDIRATRLTPLEISFPISTIGGTENALICGAMLPGKSRIRNAYISPEVENLIDFLRAIGAHIDVSGSSYIEVEGSTNLRGTSFRVIPDRIEALTWIILGAITGAKVLIQDVPYQYLESPLIHLREAGVDVLRNRNNAYICPECVTNGTIQPFEVACGTYPGVISDMQPFFVMLALRANGTSRIFDYRYPERTAYLGELSKFCNTDALSWRPGEITIRGPVALRAADADSTDLRGSMAVLMAGLAANGESTIGNVDMALRGYNSLPQKLAQLGARLKLQ